jgi:enoyl-CoA hydratase/carnithine racemase
VAEAEQFVTVEVDDGGVATIRLNRLPMNVLNRQMQEQVRAAASAITADRAVRAVVLYGGERVFAAGADVKEFAAMDHAEMLRDAERLSSSFDAVARLPMPVVAAVTGYALGGGCELALAADFRVSATDATWGQPEILLGVIPGGGGTQRLPRLIGTARAKDLIYTGRFVDAAEALEIGLVDRIVPATEVYPTARELALRLARGPTLALQAAKSAIDASVITEIATGLRLESQLFAGLFATEDRRSGMRSFLDHGLGKAEFVGR